MMPDDRQLLRRFAIERSESAFTELVTRHLPLVYSAALRQTSGDAHLAKDVAQLVFAALARKAPSLSEKIILAGWLHQATIFAARQILRGERRRRAREQQAVTMNAIQSESESADWQQIRPLLDDALERLNQTDRDALLLRFFEQRSLAQIGENLGSNEDAIRKRIARALDKLRVILQRRGVSSTTAIIAGAISSNCIQAPPIGLTQTISAAALAKGAAASTLTLTHGALKIMAWTKTQTAIATAVGILLLAGTAAVTVKQIQGHRPHSAGQKPNQMAMAKMDNTRKGLLGFIMYAEKHSNRIPTNFDLAAPYFKDASLAGTLNNDFEIVYQGSLRTISKPANVILIQEHQAWQSPNGEWAKTYGFVDGHVEIHAEANGDFTAFEQKHTLPLPR